MSQMKQTIVRSFIASADVEIYRIVRVESDGRIKHHDGVPDGLPVGVTQARAKAGDVVAVAYGRVHGLVTAGGVIAAQEDVFLGAEADGKVTNLAAGGGFLIGKSVEAAVGDGHAIEVLG